MSHEIKSTDTIRAQARRAAESDDRNGTNTACPYTCAEYAAVWHDEYAATLCNLSGEASA